MEALNHQLAAEGAPVMRRRLGVHSGQFDPEGRQDNGRQGERWGDFQVTRRLEPLEI